MNINEQKDLPEKERKMLLFKNQVETLNTFLKLGAISKAQYDVSYNGLVEKMHITPQMLEEFEKNTQE